MFIENHVRESPFWIDMIDAIQSYGLGYGSGPTKEKISSLKEGGLLLKTKEDVNLGDTAFRQK